MPNTSGPPEFAGRVARPPWCYRMWMLAGSRERFFDKLVQQYGDFVHYRGVIDFYLVNHPALVKRVLQQTNDAFDKQSPLYERFRRAFGDGLVVAEGDAWKQRRSIAQQLMGPKSVQAFFDLMVQSTLDTARDWQPHADEGSVFDVAASMESLTLDIVGRSLFHNEFEAAKDNIRHWTKVIDHFSSKPPLPVIRSEWFPSRLNRRLSTTLEKFHRFIQTMIDRRRSNPDAAEDLLALLCNWQSPEGDAQLSDEQIRDEVLGMIIGGHETSAVAMTWVWYHLSQHPQVERKLHEEIDEVIGQRTIALSDIANLRYARMVIDETLRLHPPFWFENRNVAREVELGGEVLPQGSMVLFSRYSLHRHCDFWHAPDVFDPLRFEPGNEENSRSTHAYVPFGGGPRTCVGIHFALQELVVLLATLAQRYRVEVANLHQHKVSALLTLRPKNGLPVVVSPREASP